MHEMTLAIPGDKSVVEFAEENGIEEIDTVVLEIGELSLVVPEYMEEAWYAAVPRTMLANSRLRIDTVPGNGICLDCGEVYNIVQEKGRCPKCGSDRKDVLCGEEFNIKEAPRPRGGIAGKGSPALSPGGGTLRAGGSLLDIRQEPGYNEHRSC